MANAQAEIPDGAAAAGSGQYDVWSTGSVIELLRLFINYDIDAAEKDEGTSASPADPRVRRRLLRAVRSIVETEDVAVLRLTDANACAQLLESDAYGLLSGGVDCFKGAITSEQQRLKAQIRALEEKYERLRSMKRAAFAASEVLDDLTNIVHESGCLTAEEAHGTISDALAVLQQMALGFCEPDVAVALFEARQSLAQKRCPPAASAETYVEKTIGNVTILSADDF